MSKDKEIKPNTEPKTFIVKITPLVPTASKFIGTNTLGDEERDLVRQLNTFHLCLANKNRNRGLQFGRFDCDRKAPPETRLEPFLETINFFRVAVARQDDLSLTFQERIKRVEELLL